MTNRGSSCLKAQLIVPDRPMGGRSRCQCQGSHQRAPAMAGESRGRICAVEMHSADLLRAFLRLAPVLICLFSTGSRASETGGYEEQDPIQLLPSEVGERVSSFLSVEAYLAMLQTSKGILEKFQLPLKMELEMLKRDFDESSAADLMHMHVGSAVLAKAKGKQGSLRRLLKELVGKIFAAPDGEVMDACRCALVAGKRLNGMFWNEYVSVVVGDVIKTLILLPTTTKRSG